MATHIEDQDRVDWLKTWCKKYGAWLISILCIVIAVMLGFRWWHARQNNKINNASVMFQNMLYQNITHHPNQMVQTANQIIAHYPNTIYSLFSGLFTAQYSAEHHALSLASARLKWVAQHAGQYPNILNIVYLREAQLFIAQNKFNLARKKILTIQNYPIQKNLLQAELNLKQNHIQLAKKYFAQAESLQKSEGQSTALTQLLRYQLPA